MTILRLYINSIEDTLLVRISDILEINEEAHTIKVSKLYKALIAGTVSDISQGSTGEQRLMAKPILLGMYDSNVGVFPATTKEGFNLLKLNKIHAITINTSNYNLVLEIEDADILESLDDIDFQVNKAFKKTSIILPSST